jgi:hypothetical protein
MKTNMKMAITAATLLLAMGTAHAEMQLTDWKTAGDANVTLDVETGVEWLHVDETEGMGIDDVIPLLDTTYAGWRLPTADEVSVYFMHLLPTLPDPIGYDPYTKQYSEGNGYAANSYITTMQTYVGVTGVSAGRSRWNYGMYYEDGTASSDLYASGYVHGASSSGKFINIHVEFLREGGSHASIGHVDYGVFLVSDGGTTLSSQQDPSLNANNAESPAANVSAPALLSGFALLGLAFGRRQRTKELS